MSNYPPTIFVVHPRERRSKCTVAPLRGNDAFRFWKFPRRGPESVENYVRLGLGGPLLSAEDSRKGLLILDGTWRWTETMKQEFQDVPLRSLPVWKTAYPRVSKTYDDPEEGLATIEALFAACTILGRDTTGLLDDYYWAEEFLWLNKKNLNPEV